jgi:hypothetical protein
MTSVVFAACVPPETRMFSQTTTQTSWQRRQHAVPPDDRAQTTTADVGVTVAPARHHAQHNARYPGPTTSSAVLGQHDFDFPLLSDKDGSVARAFGVSQGLLSFIRPVKRTTFVIGTDGLILDVINSETHMHIHADRPLSHAQRRPSVYSTDACIRRRSRSCPGSSPRACRGVGFVAESIRYLHCRLRWSSGEQEVTC